jgi:hypothetical protein
MTPRRPRYALAAALLAVVSLPFAAGAADARDFAIADDADATELAIAEASLRFGLPADWIRAVIQAESGGDAQAVSRAGAIGLMQLMPRTYAELRSRYGLGPDPFGLRDNVMAGTAYLRELHDLYGPVGMLAAYNAGPRRWEQHLHAGQTLPAETERYLANLGPALGFAAGDLPLSARETAAGQARADSLFAIRMIVGEDSDRTAGGASSAPDPAPARRGATAETLFISGVQNASRRHLDGATSDMDPTRAPHGASTPADQAHPRSSLSTPPDGPLFVGHHPDRPRP